MADIHTVLKITAHTNEHSFITIDLKPMKYGYVCEVLYFLLRKRFGCPLIDLPVHLKDVDNEATLDLLCALFKHRECYETCDTYT